MNGFFLMQLALGWVVGVAVIWWLPSWSRPELFFAVTVDAGFPATDAGRQIVGDYRRRALLLITAVTVLVALLGLGRPGYDAVFWVPVVRPLLYVAIFLYAFLRARRAALPYAQEPSRKRQASLTPRAEPLPGGWLGQSLPFLVLGGAVAWIASRYETLPDTIATHFDGAGVADAWAAKSWSTLLTVPAIGLALCLMLTAVSWMTLRFSRRFHLRGDAALAEGERRRAIAQLVWLINLMIAVVIAAITLSPLMPTARGHQLLMVGIMVLAVTSTPMALVFLGLKLARIRQRYGAAVDEAAAAPAGDRTRDDCWKWGMIYYNPEDPTLFVEQRFGIGFTANMARPAAVAIVAATVLLPLALVAVVVLLD